MANKQISALTAATSPLAGTELIHVQEGANSRQSTVQEIVDLSDVPVTVEEVTATSYTTVLADFAGGKAKKMNNASAQTVTVAPSISGTQACFFYQHGAGTVTFAPGAGVTINSLSSNLDLAGQWGSASLIRTATDEYLLVGALA